MATRSTIAIELPNGNIKAVYCHWDGYLSYNGKILQEHYTDAKKVAKLISKGAISSLGAEIGRKHDFNKGKDGWTKFYARDRGEDVQIDTFKNFDDYNYNVARQEYDYLFTKHGNWRVRSWRTESWELLDEAIALDEKEREEATA